MFCRSRAWRGLCRLGALALRPPSTHVAQAAAAITAFATVIGGIGGGEGGRLKSNQIENRAIQGRRRFGASLPPPLASLALDGAPISRRNRSNGLQASTCRSRSAELCCAIGAPAKLCPRLERNSQKTSPRLRDEQANERARARKPSGKSECQGEPEGAKRRGVSGRARKLAEREQNICDRPPAGRVHLFHLARVWPSGSQTIDVGASARHQERPPQAAVGARGARARAGQKHARPWRPASVGFLGRFSRGNKRTATLTKNPTAPNKTRHLLDRLLARPPARLIGWLKAPAWLSRPPDSASNTPETRRRRPGSAAA